jgi:hypothetical protein
MRENDDLPAPLSEDQCSMIELLASRGVEACADSSPNNIPGWVYAGRSPVFDVTMLLVAFRGSDPNAATFIRRVLRRVNELAQEYYGASTVETDPPQADPTGPAPGGTTLSNRG